MTEETVVFNSSPIIFLTKLGYMNFCLELFAKPYIPRGVKEEIATKKDNIGENLDRLLTEGRMQLQVIALSNLFKGLHKRIGKGESEAIVLAIQLNADCVILDDHVARKEAKRLGLKVKGTLGIISNLLRLQKIEIDNMGQFYQRLMEIEFRIKREIFDEIFKDK